MIFVTIHSYRSLMRQPHSWRPSATRSLSVVHISLEASHVRLLIHTSVL